MILPAYGKDKLKGRRADTEELFCRNIPAITPEMQLLLHGQHILIAGCGGLGGWLCEYMARLGVGEITAADGDRFVPSNFNRQILALNETLGRNKAECARHRALSIHPAIRFHAFPEMLTSQNLPALLSGKALVLDGLDSIAGRLLLEDACAVAGVPLVHGAVSGWTLQVSTVLPGSGALHRLYRGASTPQKEEHTALAFAAAACAAIQSAEALRLLCGSPPALAGRLLTADLQSMEQQIMLLNEEAEF